MRYLCQLSSLYGTSDAVALPLFSATDNLATASLSRQWTDETSRNFTDLIDSIAATISASRVIGQAATIVKLSNYLISVGSSTPQSSIISFPLSHLETVSNINYPSIELNRTEHKGENLEYRVIVSKALIFGNATARKILSQAVIVEVVTTNNINVVVRLPHIQEMALMETSTSNPVTTICKRNEKKDHAISCPKSGFVIHHNCTGLQERLNSVCPTVRSTTICSEENGRYCRATLNPYRNMTSCTCNIVTTSVPNSRRLSSASVRIGVTVLAVKVADQFAGVVRSSDNSLSDDAPGKLSYLIAMYAALIGTGVCLSVMLQFQTRRSLNIKIAVQNTLPEANETVSDNEVGRNRGLEAALNYLSGVVPYSVLGEGSMLHRALSAMTRHHCYYLILAGILGYEKQSKLQRIHWLVLAVLSDLISLFFLNAVFYNAFVVPDPGNCPQFLSQQPCIATSGCVWSGNPPACSYKSPHVTLSLVVQLSILVSIVSAAVALPVDFCLDLLSALPKSKNVAIAADVVRNVESIRQPAGRRSALIAKTRTRLPVSSSRKSIFPDIIEVKEIPSEMRMAMTLSLQQAKNCINHNFYGLQEHQHTGYDGVSHILHRQPTTVNAAENEELTSLLEGANRQRLLMPPENIDQYDHLWGLTSIHNSSTRNAIMQVLKDVETAVRIENIKLHSLPDEVAGLEIMHLFVIDMLGRDSFYSKIFKNIIRVEYGVVQMVPWSIKLMAGAILLGLLSFFVFYAILLANQRGLRWQRSFIVSCLLQFLVEIFLNETSEVIWVNMILSLLAARGIRNVHQQIQRIASALVNNREVPDAAFADLDSSQIVLNAPEYLFVSHRVAALHPELMESQVVLSFKSIAPGALATKWGAGELDAEAEDTGTGSGQSTMMSKMGGWLLRSMATTVMISLQMFGATPLALQRFVVQCVQPAFTGGIALLILGLGWVFSNPTNASVFCVCLAFSMFLYYWRKRYSRNVAVTPTTTADAADFGSPVTAARTDANIRPVSSHSNLSGKVGTIIAYIRAELANPQTKLFVADNRFVVMLSSLMHPNRQVSPASEYFRNVDLPVTLADIDNAPQVETGLIATITQKVEDMLESGQIACNNPHVLALIERLIQTYKGQAVVGMEEKDRLSQIVVAGPAVADEFLATHFNNTEFESNADADVIAAHLVKHPIFGGCIPSDLLTEHAMALQSTFLCNGNSICSSNFSSINGNDEIYDEVAQLGNGNGCHMEHDSTPEGNYQGNCVFYG